MNTSEADKVEVVEMKEGLPTTQMLSCLAEG